MSSCDLKVANTLFTKSHGSLTTFYGPRQRRATLDNILLRSRWVRSARDCSVKFPPISSDHNMLTLALQWTLKSNTPTASTRQDHSILLSDTATAQAFSKDIVDNFTWGEQVLQTTQRLSTKSRTALNKKDPKLVHHKKNISWIDPDICTLRTHYQSSRLKAQAHPSPENKSAASSFALQLSQLYLAKQETYINSICIEILKYTGDNQAKKAWDAINLTTNRKARSSGLIPAQDDHDRLDKWYNHFSKLLTPRQDRFGQTYSSTRCSTTSRTRTA